MSLIRFFAAALLSLAASSSHAFDFKSVGPNPAILYDAPTFKGTKLFIAPRGMPVEVVFIQGNWVKVRDAGGELAWIEAKALVAKRGVVVKAASAKLRAAADESAAAIMLADKGVLFELLDPQATTWVKVRHQDGMIGFIKAAEVWGI
jgi:SH3-like domain-containing protein